MWIINLMSAMCLESLILSACKAHCKLSEILYQSVLILPIITDNFNLYTFLKCLFLFKLPCSAWELSAEP
jgi:hypothetical protein